MVVLDIMDSELIQIDELKMYFSKPFHINDKITIYTPTIGQIIDFGEREYYSMIHSLTCIPSDMKSQLFDMKIDYEEISDFELFIMLSRTLNADITRLVLGDLDLSKLSVGINPDNNETILIDEETGLVIDRLIYMKMVTYLRKVHNITPKVEKAKNKTTKKILIQLDRDKIAKAKKTPYKSQLKYLISAMMRYPGFPYKSYELEKVGLCEFMDYVMGSQIYISATTLLQGSYSGMIDTSKINKKEFNWMRSYDE